MTVISALSGFPAPSNAEQLAHWPSGQMPQKINALFPGGIGKNDKPGRVARRSRPAGTQRIQAIH
jgi:hypothetical protein